MPFEVSIQSLFFEDLSSTNIAKSIATTVNKLAMPTSTYVLRAKIPNNHCEKFGHT